MGGYWRGWDEIGCEGCGALMYKKYSKKFGEKNYCPSCYEKMGGKGSTKFSKRGKKNPGWHEEQKSVITARGIEEKAPRHREAALKNKMGAMLREPMKESSFYPEGGIGGMILRGGRPTKSIFKFTKKTLAKNIEEYPFGIYFTVIVSASPQLTEKQNLEAINQWMEKNQYGIWYIVQRDAELRKKGELSRENIIEDMRHQLGWHKIKEKASIPIDTVRIELVRMRDAPQVKINNPNDVVALVKEMEDYDREHAKILHLDTQNQVIGIENISTGSLSEAVVHPREAVKGAILNNAASAVFVHNHPSGLPQPSHNDLVIAKKLKDAFVLVGIELLDAIIIGKDDYISLKEKDLSPWALG